MALYAFLVFLELRLTLCFLCVQRLYKNPNLALVNVWKRIPKKRKQNPKPEKCSSKRSSLPSIGDSPSLGKPRSKHTSANHTITSLSLLTSKRQTVTHLPRGEQISETRIETITYQQLQELSRGGYLLDITVEMRGRQRGVGWVCVLAGINSPKQSPPH